MFFLMDCKGFNLIDKFEEKKMLMDLENKIVDFLRFCWIVEFLVGLGGFVSKEEIFSSWFNIKVEVVNDVNKNVDNEV